MLWKPRVRISAQSYRIALPVVCVMRVLGMFPITIYHNKSGILKMKWSPLYATCSWGIGLFLHSVSCMGLLKDMFGDHSKSIRVRSPMDTFVYFLCLIGNQVLAFSAFFIIPSKFMTFCAYVKCINETDSILLMQHSNWERLRRAIAFYSALLAVFVVVLGDHFMYVATVGKNLHALPAVCRYLICVVVVVIQSEFVFMARSLEIRMRRLNDILEFFNYRKLPQTKTAMPGDIIHFIMKEHGERIDLLMAAYLKLSEAAGHQNALLGGTGLVSTAAVFWNIITSAYALLLELSGKRRYPVFVMKTVWTVLHAGRFLMVIQPWHRCSMEAETTKNLVCKLQYSNFGQRVRKQLRRFQLILGLRTIRFTLAAVVDVDMTLLTSLLGATMTYLVIVLQYRVEDD